MRRMINQGSVFDHAPGRGRTAGSGVTAMKSADFWLFVHLFLGASAVTPVLAQQPNSGVDRLYVLECGHGTAPDQGRFSPGYNDGKPFDLVDNCYLIHHAQGYLLWGTGVADRFFERPGGLPSLGGRSNWMRSNTLARQLEQLHIKPSDIRFIGLTNSHIDHIGNLEMFPKVMVLMQKSEWDFAETHRYQGTPEEARFNPDHPVTQVDGDYDVFGDGSVQLVRTPAVTSGNQSLLVKLPKTGAIVLSGDVISLPVRLGQQDCADERLGSSKDIGFFQTARRCSGTQQCGAVD